MSDAAWLDRRFAVHTVLRYVTLYGGILVAVVAWQTSTIPPLLVVLVSALLMVGIGLQTGGDQTVVVGTGPETPTDLETGVKVALAGVGLFVGTVALWVYRAGGVTIRQPELYLGVGLLPPVLFTVGAVAAFYRAPRDYKAGIAAVGLLTALVALLGFGVLILVLAVPVAGAAVADLVFSKLLKMPRAFRRGVAVGATFVMMVVTALALGAL